MAVDSIQAFARALANGLAALGPIEGSGHESSRLLEDLGYMRPPGLAGFVLDGLRVAPVVDAIGKLDLSVSIGTDESSIELDLYAELFDAVQDLLHDLGEIEQTFRARLPADYLTRTRIHERLPRQLLDLLIMTRVRANAPMIYDLLLLLGIFRLEPHAADAPNFRTEHTAFVIAFDRVATLLSDPSEVLRGLGWGTVKFNAALLLALIGQLLSGISSDIRLRVLPRRVEERLRGVPAPEAKVEPLPQLMVSLLKGLGWNAPDIGLTAFGTRPSAPGRANAGIGFAPFIRRTKERTFALAKGLGLSLDTSLDVDSGVVVMLRPGHAPTLQTGVITGGPIAPAVGHVLYRLVYEPSGAEVLTLLKIPGGSRLEVRQVAGSVGLRASGAGGPEFAIELELRGARFVLSLEGGSTLFSTLIPKDLVRAELDLAIGWASGRAYLRGSTALAVTFPVQQSLGPIELKSVTVGLAPGPTGIIPVEVSATVAAALGPLTLLIERIGLNAQFAFTGGTDGNLGPLDLDLGFKVPSGIGLTLDAGPVSGGGYLAMDPAGGRYAGVLQLKLPVCSAVAYGIYEQVQGKASFVAVLGLRFTPAIQLGFGFALSGVGGLVGLNRRADVDLLRERLASGAAGNVLFCEDPLRNAPALLGDLASFFPPVASGFLVGPTLQVGWLSPLVRFDLGIMIELPGPSKIVILGSARLMIGADETLALLYVRMDILGCIDFEHKLISFDAQLVNSHALGIFRLSGGMAFRLAYGDNPYILMSVGGFHPRFDPGPLKIPTLARVGASFGISILLEVNLRLELYLAFTSNTLQLGALVEASMQLGPLQADGHFQFDALIQFQPFMFEADFSAGFNVRAFGISLASVDIEGRLSGPGPLVVHASGSIRRFGIKIKGSATFELGDDNADSVATLASVVQALAPELSRPENLHAEGADVTALSRPNRAAVVGVLVLPRGSLVWTQKRAPLKTLIDRFEGVPLEGSHELRLEGPTDWTVADASDWFSPGRFSTLDTKASQTLNNATFQELPSGVRIGFAADTRAGDLRSVKLTLNLIKRPVRARFGGIATAAYLNGALASTARDRSTTPPVPSGAPKVSVQPETSNVRDAKGATVRSGQTPFQAFQLSRESPGWVAQPSSDEVVAL